MRAQRDVQMPIKISHLAFSGIQPGQKVQTVFDQRQIVSKLFRGRFELSLGSELLGLA